MAPDVCTLHALLTANGAVALWAESRRERYAPGSRRKKAAPHPHAVPASVLAERLGKDAAELRPDVGTLLLPSYATTPVPSPGRVGAGPRSGRSAVRLRPWLVPVLTTRSGAAIRPPVDTPGFRLAPSLGYLLDVVAFAHDMAARGRVVPALDRFPDAPTASWKPVITGIDRDRFALLSSAMPAACRAEPVRPGALDGPDAVDVLTATVDALVDTEVRRRLGALQGRTHPHPAGDPAMRALWDALVSDDARLTVPSDLVEELAQALEAWHNALSLQNPVRACLRLVAPDERPDADTWRLEILAQAVADPSVLIPAERVWRAEDETLYRWADRPERQLLADLGRASVVYPTLAAALQGPRPTGMDLDTDRAYEFLTHAEVLAQAGLGVLAPAWWRRPRTPGVRLTTTNGPAPDPMPAAVGRDTALTRDEIVDCHWSIALGNEIIPEPELAELAAAKVPLIRVRGRWAYVDRERLMAALTFVRRARAGRVPAHEVLRTIGLRSGDEAVVPVTASGQGWLADLLSGNLESRVPQIATPTRFAGRLRPYQRRGVAWLAFLDRVGLGACLADDMGLGKGVQILALEVMLRNHGRRPPTLVICPTSVVGNWRNEAKKFAPHLSVHVHHGSERIAVGAFPGTMTGHDLVISTYEMVSRDIAGFAAVSWDRVVLDEAQNVKNHGTRRARAIRRVPARHRVALTGTPVENRLSDFWAIMDAVNPGMLGTAHAFRARYAVPIERYHDQDAACRLRTATKPFLLRRLKTDPTIAPDLPAKTEITELCNLTAEQATLYRAVVDDMLSRIRESNGVRYKGLVLAAMTKLKQVCNHPAHLLGDESELAGRSGKLARLEELLDGALLGGQRVVCFTQFATFGARLQRYLTARFGIDVLYLHGGLSLKERDAVVARSQSESGPPLLLASLKAGGSGLNLTAANHVIHIDRWWNPAVEDQASDRTYRIGQHQPVQVRKLLCIGTLEERIDQMIGEKTALAQSVVRPGDGWLTELSYAQIRDLVTLSHEPSS